MILDEEIAKLGLRPEQYEDYRRKYYRHSFSVHAWDALISLASPPSREQSNIAFTFLVLTFLCRYEALKEHTFRTTLMPISVKVDYLLIRSVLSCCSLIHSNVLGRPCYYG